MSITATIENHMIKLPAGVHVPNGTQVEIRVIEALASVREEPGSFFETVRDLIGSVEGPVDLAAEHDHYAHGAPKRKAP